MSRQLKFRAWDSKNEEWLGKSDPNAVVYYGFHLFGEVTLFQHISLKSLPHVTVDQFTGLKDKNDKDIYENDVVIVDQRRCQVVWVEEEACYRAKPELTENMYYVMSWNGKGSEEVIGNVHETPELLKT